MAYQNRYQYETSPRKVQPEYTPTPKKYPKKSTAKKTKNKNATKSVPKQKAKPKLRKKQNAQIKVLKYVAIGFIILFAISYRNSLINESFSEIKELKTSLAALEKENQQMEVNIENNLNLKTIEQSAKEMLGMQKLDNTQTIYVNLPKEDYIEPATEEIIKTNETNWFQKIINFLTGNNN